MLPDLGAILAQYDECSPLEEAFTIPASWYTDAGVAGLEGAAVFGRTWQVIGRVDQVAAPGQFFTAEIAGEPLLAVRGADGLLRGFFNVCRHHAASVATEACGRARFFQCPYHGWKYGLDGSLKGAPDFQGVRDFDRSQNGLVPVRVEEWERFVFAALDENAPPLGLFLGQLQALVAPLHLNGLSFYARKSYTLNCNWKVFVDNYLDGGYHVPYLHKGLNSVLDYTQYTIENGENYSLQSSPMVASGVDPAVAASRGGDRAHYFWLYPNFMINLYEGVMDTNLVVPLGIGRTRVDFDFYFADTGRGAEARNAASVAVSDTVQEEDLGICESVQRGLSSRAYRAGRLSVRRESGEHLFHRLLARDLKGEALRLS